jgi:hypothetical protein
MASKYLKKGPDKDVTKRTKYKDTADRPLVKEKRKLETEKLSKAKNKKVKA